MADVAAPRELYSMTRWKVPTGLHLEMPKGVEAQVRSRSGLSINWGVIVLNAPGTIDSDYRGEVMVTLMNLGDKIYVIKPGERVAQIVFAPVIVPDSDPVHLMQQFCTRPSITQRVSSLLELTNTDRGASGHGSTGT